MKTSIVTTSAAWLLVTVGAFAQGPKPLDPTPGIAIGSKAPGFVLKDQAGRDRSLDDLLKGGKVALVFYRSADW